jgi:NodT family efflux transporter outer membrane factor (OMF) lipoprotein
MMKQATAKTLSAYRILVLITLAGLVLGGCTVGPDYVRPEAEVNPSWLESSETLQEEPAEIRDWWTAFNDPVLTRLVHEAYEQNLSLRAAGLRVIQARAARGIAVGEFFPQEQAIQADYGKVKISDNNRNNPPYHGPFQTAGISFDAAWELDLWGKFRRNIYAADAALLASIAAYDDVLVTLVAEVGLTYVQIRTLERRIELAKVNVALQRQSLGITESRYRNGKVSQLDVTEARATLSNTQAGVPSLESSLRDAKLSLGVLLGRTPGELEQSLAGSSGIPTTPAELAIGVPADLLRRRPDVRAAERVAAFRSEQIGIATADLFPSIAIGGSYGVQASDAGGISLGNNLFDSGSKVWSIGPALNWPILNYGRISEHRAAGGSGGRVLAVRLYKIARAACLPDRERGERAAVSRTVDHAVHGGRD